MKLFVSSIVFIFIQQLASAQYYYKDIFVAHQLTDKWNAYKKNKVRSVKLLSFEGNNQPTDGFVCEQTVAADFSQISTHTKSTYTNEDFLFSYYSTSGALKRTMDTSDRYQTATDYAYDAKGNITTITNTSTAAADQVKETEVHQWKYDDNGKAVNMLKIKNYTDTTFVQLVTDEKGNMIEEHAARNKISLPVIYDYYDDNNRLTDVVRYNAQAGRLLPDYIFEYNADGYTQSMLAVAEGSSNYQKWIYQYNTNGLIASENCYNKQKELVGKIQYEYVLK